MPKFGLKALGIFLFTIIVFLELLSPHPVTLAQDDSDEIRGLAWSPDGNLIVAVHQTYLSFWDAHTGEEVADIDMTRAAYPEQGLERFAKWSPDGTRLAVGALTGHGSDTFGPGGWVLILDVAAQDISLELSGNIDAIRIVSDVIWSPDGTMIAATFVNPTTVYTTDISQPIDSHIIVWNSQTGEKLQQLNGNYDFVFHNGSQMAWSPDSSRIAIAQIPLTESHPQLYDIWDVTTGNIVANLETPTFYGGVTAWTPDSQHLIVSDEDGNLQFWDVTSQEVVETIHVFENSQRFDMILSPDTTRLAISRDDRIEIWDVNSQQRLQVYSDNLDLMPAWSPDSNQLVYVKENNTLAIVDLPPALTPTPSAFCPTAPSPRLTVGQQARVVPTWASNLRAEPSLDAERGLIIPGRGVFTVLDGPLCEADYVWWQVEYDGRTGWTAEGRESEYWLEPLPASETSTECPGAPAQRLRVGAQARQALDQDPLLVLEHPGTDNTLFQIYPGDVVDVIGGPLCFPVDGNNSSWWQIRNGDGLTGWVAEGRPDRYYLDPLGE